MNLPGKISTEDFFNLNNNVANWWNENRNRFIIHYFNFNTNKPIGGTFIGSDTIVINKNSFMPLEIKLFTSLHESKHGDQYKEGTLGDEYWNCLIQKDKNKFIKIYETLEIESNDYAIDSMKDLGFFKFIEAAESKLRLNEKIGGTIYNMMLEDIGKLKPKNFFDYLIKGILNS